MPVSIDGERLGLVELLERAAEIGARHGAGIVDHVEDRIVGLKVRDLYEVPAAAIVIPAHRELEKLVSTIHQNNFKLALEDKWAYLCYAGLWYEPLREDLDAYMESANRFVTGEVTMKLYKGSATVVARELALRALRPRARLLRRVRGRLQPGREPRVHRAVHAAEPDGAPGSRARPRVDAREEREMTSAIYEYIGRFIVRLVWFRFGAPAQARRRRARRADGASPAA